MKDAYKLIHNGILALARAERQGIRVDIDYATKQRDELTSTIKDLEESFYSTKFYRHWERSRGGKKPNIDSGPQLRKFLYDVKKLKPMKLTATGGGSTDEEALMALNIPELLDMLNIRKLKKLRDTYLEAFIRESVDGYIHPFFNLHRVTTYRSSSDSPNFQNIPKRDEESHALIRSCLFPRPGRQLLEVDYGALEVRIAACYHKDPAMLKYLREGLDMHADMAKMIFFLDKLDKTRPGHRLLRSATKNGFVFPQFYGDYYGNNVLTLSQWTKLPTTGKYKPDIGTDLGDNLFLSTHLKNNGISSIDDFSEHLKQIEHHFWNERFPVYNRWKLRWFREYQRNGYIDMMTGFRCSGLIEKNSVINYPVQGSAFHCLLWSFIELDRIMRDEGWDTKLVGQIHDSILLDVHPDELDHVLAVVKRVTCEDLVEHWPWIIVPLEVEAELCGVDLSWYHKEEIEI